MSSRERQGDIDREWLRQLPKAELHCHLDGSVRAATLLDLARDHEVRMPATAAGELQRFMRVDDAANLEDYLERFAITLSVMQHAPALERIAFELVEDAARDGVLYIETRFAPTLNTKAGLDETAVIEAVWRGLTRAEAEFGVMARIIVVALRNLEPSASIEAAEVAASTRASGVVGFDLAGGERGNPAREHAQAFELAHSHGLRCTCHAGEGDGADSIAQALHSCQAERIGHATRLFEDPGLVAEARRDQIPLEICITSNVQTRAAASFDAHPVRRYFDEGLRVVLNTDNRLMSGTTLTDEYERAAQHLDFTREELTAIALNGFESAFVSEEERKALLAQARERIAGLAR